MILTDTTRKSVKNSYEKNVNLLFKMCLFVFELKGGETFGFLMEKRIIVEV